MKVRSVHRQILELIGRDIVDGRWAPHQAIEPQAVGTHLGVSRTVIREVVRVLEARGLVTARAGNGTMVCATADWNLLDPDLARWIAASPHHDQLKIQAKEFTEALHTLTPALGENPYLAAALAALDTETPTP